MAHGAPAVLGVAATGAAGPGASAESVIEPDRFWNETGVPAWRVALQEGRLPVLRTCRSDTPGAEAAHHA